MKPSEFESLVQELTHECAQDPETYARKVKELAWLGYGYLALLLLSALGCFAIGILMFLSHRSGGFIQLSIFCGLFAFALIRSLTFRYPPPEGRAIEPRQFPEFHQDVEAIRRELKAPKIHSIKITSEINAAMVQQPWFGLMGFHKNYLIIGLPLAAMLSREELRSVIAHELGHLARTHSSFSGWVYRVRLAWINLQTAFQETAFWGNILIQPFVNRYVPKLSAYTFVLARQNEYEADAYAAKLTDSHSAATALYRIHTIDPQVEEWWEAFWKQAETGAEPATQPFSELVRWLENSGRLVGMNVELPRALARPADATDTHPSLRERLQALGVQAPTSVPPIEGPTALQTYFAPEAPEWLAELDEAWLATNRATWKNLHEDSRQQRQTYEELSKRTADGENLKEDEDWQLATLTERFMGSEPALAQYHSFRNKHPKLAGAPLRIGEILWKKRDPAARAFLEEAAQLNPLLQGPVHQMLRQLSLETDSMDDAARSQTEIQEFADKMDAANQERAGFSETDRYYLPVLTDAELASLRNAFAEHRKIKSAYVLGKTLLHFPDNPLYVVAFDTHSFAYEPANFANQTAQTIAQSVNLGGQFFVFSLNSHAPKMRRVIRAFPESRVYSK